MFFGVACRGLWLPEVCAAHYLLYSRKYNITREWDLSHSLSNASKLALKRPTFSLRVPCSPCERSGAEMRVLPSRGRVLCHCDPRNEWVSVPRSQVLLGCVCFTL